MEILLANFSCVFLQKNSNFRSENFNYYDYQPVKQLKFLEYHKNFYVNAQ